MLGNAAVLAVDCRPFTENRGRRPRLPVPRPAPDNGADFARVLARAIAHRPDPRRRRTTWRASRARPSSARVARMIADAGTPACKLASPSRTPREPP